MNKDNTVPLIERIKSKFRLSIYTWYVCVWNAATVVGFNEKKRNYYYYYYYYRNESLHERTESLLQETSPTLVYC